MLASVPSLAPDRSVPGLVVKIGHYPLHHGGVGAIRSLGRLGVPVCAVTEDRRTPAALSRYLTGRFVWPTTGLESPERLTEGLLRIGRAIGRPAVLIPTDEEAAVLVAEHADALRERFLLPRLAAGLPRRLASKQGLHELCLAHGVPTPATASPDGPADDPAPALALLARCAAPGARHLLQRGAPAGPPAADAPPPVEGTA